jgi:hypothetical protein
MANKTVGDVIAAANAIFAGVTPAIKRVYTEAPDTAPSGSGDLPCVIPIVLSGEQPPAQAMGLQRKNYTIRYLLLITPYSKSLVSVEKQCRPYLDAVLDAFYPHVRLGVPFPADGISGIFLSNLGSAKYGDISYNPGNVYVGYELTLTATVQTVMVATD